MARVFTIAPGLENMGGLKTGGQGSIYKGRRIGEIITAIKILPTPIFSESADDKNWLAFTSEVEKLKRVNEMPNPNVVKILSSGITEAGNFPYIEMEFIDGPDLEELLHAPDHGVFTISETLKVAEQLSNALAHCHSLDVKHGDIKSNNVKFNVNTGNYVLLDFGLAVISDEQRRSSIRQSGTVEFMAPEQYSGQMLLQSDVYSFGIILFELLTGDVPFALKGKGETARNEVRLAHMTTPVPNLLEQRRLALPSMWEKRKQEREMQVPQWLVGLIEKCLQKKPEKRFANGSEIHNFITRQFLSAPASTSVRVNNISLRPMLKEDMVLQQEQLRKQLSSYKQDLLQKEAELSRLKQLLLQKEIHQQQYTLTHYDVRPQKEKKVSKVSFFILLMFTLGLGAFAMYPVIKNVFLANRTTNNPNEKGNDPSILDARKKTVTVTSRSQTDTSGKSKINGSKTVSGDSALDKQNEEAMQETQETVEKIQGEQSEHDKSAGEGEKSTNQTDENKNSATNPPDGNNPTTEANPPEHNAVSKKYLVVSKAYFYNEPDENTRRNEFISPLEKAVVQALNERYDFIYVVITNPQGQVFKGWLRKKELKLFSID